MYSDCASFDQNQGLFYIVEVVVEITFVI